MLPHTGKIADEICVLRAMHTEAINHDPAITFIQTGSQLPGRPSIGSWIDYGLGSDNENLPAFVVLNSLPGNGMPDQGLLSRLWGAGFLPSRYQGVQFRGAGDPVLHLSNPPGISREQRRGQLDGLAALNRRLHERVGDPEIETRIAQYEMAFRMQASVPDLVDTSGANRNTSMRSTAKTPASPAPLPPTVCWPGGWPSAMSASSSFTTAAGITTPGSPTSCRSWRATPTSPRRA